MVEKTRIELSQYIYSALLVFIVVEKNRIDIVFNMGLVFICVGVELVQSNGTTHLPCVQLHNLPLASEHCAHYINIPIKLETKLSPGL